MRSHANKNIYVDMMNIRVMHFCASFSQIQLVYCPFSSLSPLLFCEEAISQIFVFANANNILLAVYLPSATASPISKC